MAVYMINYDLKDASSQKYEDLHEEIKSFGAWWHYMESTWLVDTSLNAQQMSDRIRAKVGDEYHLVIKITRKDKQGWLPQKAWDWINNRLTDN